MKSHLHSYLLTLGHICTDITQGAIPAMLPFFIMTHGMSYAAAASLVLSCSIVSSVIQPLFGWLGDKKDSPWLMSLGLVFAGSGIALLGFVEAYPLMLLSCSICGIGVALFHPEGGKLANFVAGDNKGAGLSNFSVGGNIGFALGPVIATFSLGLFGMHGTALFLIPTYLLAAILFSQRNAYRRFGEMEQERRVTSGQSDAKDDWPGFIKLTTINFLRSIIGTSLMVFIPLYWIAILGQPATVGALMLTAYSTVGAVATFVGGRIADRVGMKRLVISSFVLAAPLLILFTLTTNLILATVLILAVSICHGASYGPMVAVGQSYLPNRLGLASGISLGVVVSVGGATSPLIGMIGDTYGLTTSFAVICSVAFLAMALSVLVVKHKPINSTEKIETEQTSQG